jgi:plastocyanin
MRRQMAAAVAVALLVAAMDVGCGAQPSSEVTIRIRYSAFEPATVRVPVGVPVTIELVNNDPIDHEWIVGDEALHEAHRTGTHPAHDQLPTEVTVPALETRTTVVTFDQAGSYAFICHLPAHEAYGMTGVIVAG